MCLLCRKMFLRKRDSKLRVVLLNNFSNSCKFSDHFLMVASALKRISDLDVFAHQHINLDLFFLLESQIKQFWVHLQEIYVSPMFHLPPMWLPLFSLRMFLKTGLAFLSWFSCFRSLFLLWVVNYWRFMP